MESTVASRRLRLAGLTAVTLVLGALLARRLTAPSPAFAGTDSAADRCHLIPNDRNQLVLYDPQSRRVLTFCVANGTNLRLQGWRDTRNDPRLWDTSLLKAVTLFSNLETKTGMSTQYMSSSDPRTGSMQSWMEAERKKRKFKFEGLAGEDLPKPAATGR